MLRAWPIVVLMAARASWAVLAILAGGLVLWRSLVWLRTTWSIGTDGLVVRSGIVWTRVQTVPPQRVQQVEVRRALRHRIAGVAAVRIGLAGGGESSQVELDALSLDDAARLGAVLERWRDQVTTPAPAAGAGRSPWPPPVAPPTPLFGVTTGQLVIAGLTGRSLWLAPLAALAGLVQFLSDARLDDDATGALRDRLAAASPAITIVAVMAAALVVTGISTVVTHHGLEVARTPRDLVVRRGLLEQRSAVIPQRRVQTVELATNVVRARFGLASLDVRTADLGPSDSSGMTSTSIPIGRRDDLDRLVPHLLPQAAVPSELARHPRAAVRREVLRRGRRLVPVTLLAALLLAGPDALVLAAVAGTGALAAVVTGIVAGRRMRSGWTPTCVVTERGALARRRWLVPVDRIQSVALSANPFQRRSRLASIRLDVAGTVGGVELRDLDEHHAQALFEQLARTI